MPVRHLAAFVLGLEAIGVLALAGWQVVALVGGDTDSVVSSVALIVLTVIGAAIIGAFAVATAREVSAGRSGGIVTQLLILSVAIGAVTGEWAAPGIALLIAAPAVVGLILLILAVRASAPPRRDDG
ncbi:MAG: histidine kinase [Microbacterium sp. 71-36]|uniref:histidine kinase n=1 Tax=unclassified Microbacterium TaxID=2609290 RepID=UPI00086EB74A|nr:MULTISPECIES: histidine kinase [unclassified Microbacterium]MBN9212026.1 histidine kinase [Microbacterium sp.]ODU49519.1 MAG: histidine kinase [Microbacterium sp. SCN 70-10]OJV76161.1 MAG: histidine kinase [Microbacterium sp. 71-36]